jgi:glycine/D-amino acid oxidase-like deaminating enzyme
MVGSYWQRGWHDRWVGLPNPRTVDFAVIGGGFAGLTTAIHLRAQHPNASIALFEAERVGFGASGRNAGFLSPLPAPVWLLGAERSPEQAWGAREINKRVHEVARWIGELAPACELAPARLALQAQHRVGDRALRELIRAVERAELPHRVAESRVWPGNAVLEMDAYTVHPYKLVCGLAEHAHRLDVQIRERTRVEKIEGVRAGGARLHIAGTIVHANKVVACTNAYTRSIALDEPPLALVVHAFMAATQPVDRIVRDGDFVVEVNTAQAYHRMHEGRVIYGGIDRIRPLEELDVPARERAQLEALIAKSFPSARLAIDHAWSGRFHATSTGLPIIRTTDDNYALVHNVGYGGTGVALALACGSLAACVASNGMFTNLDDARLLALIASTRISVRDSLRAVARVVRGLAMPWR